VEEQPKGEGATPYGSLVKEGAKQEKRGFKAGGGYQKKERGKGARGKRNVLKGEGSLCQGIKTTGGSEKRVGDAEEKGCRREF